MIYFHPPQSWIHSLKFNEWLKEEKEAPISVQVGAITHEMGKERAKAEAPGGWLYHKPKKEKKDKGTKK